MVDAMRYPSLDIKELYELRWKRTFCIPVKQRAQQYNKNKKAAHLSERHYLQAINLY